MVMVSYLYIAVGFFGYLKYGENVTGSITLNLPVEITLPWVHRRVAPDHHLKAEYALRYLMVMITFSLAAAIPKLDLFISLVGSVSSSTLALMAPPIIDTVTKGPHCSWQTLIKNSLIFLVGFFGFLLGSYVSVGNIFKYFMGDE